MIGTLVLDKDNGGPTTMELIYQVSSKAAKSNGNGKKKKKKNSDSKTDSSSEEDQEKGRMSGFSFLGCIEFMAATSSGMEMASCRISCEK